jgi:3-oxoacyl-[acyl-carrier-protein] synthase-1
MNQSTGFFILGVGARTPIGLDAPSSAAAQRAGISGAVEHPFLVDCVGDPVTGALDTQLDARLFGAARLVALAEPAIREACACVGSVAAESARIPLFLGLPELRPGFTQNDVESICGELKNVHCPPLRIAGVQCFNQGHASGFVALAAAINRLKAQEADICLVGGVDSYFHPETLEWLDSNLQLQGSVSRSSFVPGEGAGFLLLSAAAEFAGVRKPAAAVITEPALGCEANLIKTSKVCVGSGLSDVISNALLVLSPQADKVQNIICDINGERYRAEEWGFASLRLSRHFRDPTAYWAPADCWGDMGAASAPLFAMLACQAAQRGYAEGGFSLIWVSSECGVRAAAIVKLAIMG